jgi:Integrase core domain
VAVRLHPPPPGRRGGGRDRVLAGRPLPVRAQRDRAPGDHRAGHPGHLPRRLPEARRPGLHPDQLNGLVYTTRLAGGRGGRNGLENELRAQGVTQKNGRPSHPQTQGKVERFQQTLQKWLAAQVPAASLAELQHQLDAFTDLYNTRRPHRALPHRSTPAAAYTARPKAVPGDRTTDTHHRVRADRIDDTGKVTLRHAGQLYHIGVGRTHARTRVLLLIRDLHIRIINAATGELLRELTLNPARNHQPTGRPNRPTPRTPRKRPNPEP